jgi:hypothetical protein
MFDADDRMASTPKGLEEADSAEAFPALDEVKVEVAAASASLVEVLNGAEDEPVS